MAQIKIKNSRRKGNSTTTLFDPVTKIAEMAKALAETAPTRTSSKGRAAAKLTFGPSKPTPLPAVKRQTAATAPGAITVSMDKQLEKADFLDQIRKNAERRIAERLQMETDARKAKTEAMKRPNRVGGKQELIDVYLAPIRANANKRIAERLKKELEARQFVKNATKKPIKVGGIEAVISAYRDPIIENASKRIAERFQKEAAAEQLKEEASTSPIFYADGLNRLDLLKLFFTNKEYDLPSWDPDRSPLSESEMEQAKQRMLESRENHPIYTAVADSLTDRLPIYYKYGPEQELRSLRGTDQDLERFHDVEDTVPYQLGYWGTEAAQILAPGIGLEKLFKGVNTSSKLYPAISRAAKKINVKPQTLEKLADDIVKSAKADLTFGAGMNAYEAYARGLNGEEFTRQVMEDTAKDLLLDAIIGPIPTILKNTEQYKQLLKKVRQLLKNS